MKSRVNLLLLSLVLSTSGCLLVETTETRVRFDKHGKPPQITIFYRSISSDAAKPEEVKKDFEELLKDWQGDEFLVEQVKEGMVVKERSVYLEKGRLTGRMVAVSTGDKDKLNALVTQGERIMVLDAEDNDIVETNGRILKTERNYVLAWPEEVEEIYWIQRMRLDPEDREKFDRNGAEMVKLFEEYQQRGKVSETKSR